MALWHPDARRVIYSDLPFMADIPKKLVWHTTEGFGLPVYQGSHPHFTINPDTGALWQHSPINRAVKTLRNPAGGVNTNTAGAIQVEIIGFADKSDNWPRGHYDELSDLARWIERNAGVARQCSVRFGGHDNLPNRLSGSAWMDYKGHLGHQHVPENDHWDPGALRIAEVLDLRSDPYRWLNDSEQGPDVSAFQRAVNRIAENNCRPDHKVTRDGVFGPDTWKHGAWAVWMRGVHDTVAEVFEGGIGPNEQTWARDYDSLSDAQKERAANRRESQGRCD